MAGCATLVRRVALRSWAVDGDFEVWQSESADTTGDPEPVFFVAVSQLEVGGWWSLERFYQKFRK